MVLLFLLGTVLAVANFWFAAARSTIPLHLDDQIVGRQQRREKHPGKDDVYLLDLRHQGVIQVDKDVFEAVSNGATIRKARWSRQLEHDERSTDLEWSEDFRGMLLTMPGALLVMLVTIAFATRRN